MQRPRLLSLTLILLCLITLPSLVHANEENIRSESSTGWSKGQKLLATNIIANAFIGIWGVSAWDYGRYDMHFRSEDWFQQDTKHGGADKIGHAYASFGLGHMFAWYFERWGYSQTEAAAFGALTSLGMHTFMEIGDSFSWFGFSVEDFTMNFVGSYLAFYLYQHPQRNRYLDLRIEYIPTHTTYDFFTDYHGLKYLVALKLEAFSWIKNPVLQYLELHVGYYARGYEEVDAPKKRVVYGAVAVNLTRLFRQHGFRRTDWFLRYFQPPYSYLPISKQL